MKKRVYITVFLVVLFSILASLFAQNGILARADDEENGLQTNISEQIEKLDTSELEKYVREIGFNDGKTVSERLNELIDGNFSSASDFMGYVGEILFSDLKNFLPAFACITAIALLGGILSDIEDGILGKSTKKAILFATFSAVLIPVLSVLTVCVQSAKSCLESLVRQIGAIFPILITLMSANGETVSVSVYTPTVALLCTVISELMQKVVLPLSVTTFAFSLTGNLSQDLKLDKFAGFVKSTNKWLIGICIAVFGAFFSVQGLASAGIDKVTRQAAKYAIGNGIPIVGGFLSNGFDLVFAGCALIKNSVGGFGIVLLMTVLSKPVALMIGANLLFRFSSAVCAPLGGQISKFLSECADNINYTLSSVLFSGLMYFITLVLVLCTTGVFL